MKLLLALLLALVLEGASAATPAIAPATKARPAPLPGADWAQTISTVTGVAISPLLGMGGVGAYQYFHAPKEQRPRLPWFAQPYVWVPALLLVGVAFAKDTMGPVLPTALKKPFDVAELFENKISALVAAGAFVPLIISFFPDAAGGDGASWNASGFAAIDLARIGNVLLTPFAMVTFVLVWIAAHSINVLILISPFGTVDAALKIVRTALLSSVTITSFTNPVAGAIWSLVLIVLCYFVAGWSFRMTVFGTLFAWDLCTLRRTRFQPDPRANRAFTARPLEDVPVRTCGRVRREETGRFVFEYRPWLVRPARTLTLPEGQYAIGRALLHPELLRLEGDRTLTVLKFPPRCRTHDEALARIYRLGEVRDVGIVAMWGWLKELLGFAPARRPATVPAPAAR